MAAWPSSVRLVPVSSVEDYRRARLALVRIALRVLVLVRGACGRVLWGIWVYKVE